MNNICVYLEKVDSSLSNIAISGLAGILNIPDQTATQIVSSAPIILFNNLETKQAGAIVRAFSLIVDKGIGIASAPFNTREEKAITWPQSVSIRGRSLEDYAFASLDSGFLAAGFSCPRCGEKFSIMSNFNADLAAESVGMAAQASAYEEVEEVKEVAVEEEVAEEIVGAEEVVEEIVEEVVEEPIEEELVEEAAEEIVEEIIDEIEEVVEEVEITEDDDIMFEEAEDEIILDNIVEVVEAEEIEKIEEVEVEVEVESSDAIGTVEAIKPLQGESTFETIALGEGEFSVRLKGIKGKSDKEKANEAIQEIMGISSDDARKMLKKVIINAVKGVDEDTANAIAAKFEAKGIDAQVKAKK